MSRAMRTAAALLVFAIVPIVGATNGPGDTDLSFNAGSGVDGLVYSLTLQADGKLLIGGEFTTVKGLVRVGIARLNANGDGDASFAPGAGALGTVRAIAIQPADGKILVGGNFTAFNGNTSRKYLVRLNPDGSIDGTFSPPLIKGPVYAITLQPDGRVLIGGGNPLVADRNGIARLNADGTLDSGFYPGTGISGNDSPPAYVSAVVVQPSDGKVIIGGSFTSVNGTNCYGLARLTSNGSLDADFFGPTGPGSGVNALALDTDEKIFVTGTLLVPYLRSTVARLNADGSLDDGYANPTTDGGALAAVLQPDDHKLIVGGYFTLIDGVARKQIARLNEDGTLDPTFNLLPGPQIPAYVTLYALARQVDGKVIWGGDASQEATPTRSRVERLTTAAGIDGTFVADDGINGLVVSLASRPDGKILVGGRFTAKTIPRKRLAQLNRDGTLDTAFDTSQGPGNWTTDGVTAIAVQSNGKVIVGGTFSDANGGNVQHLLRLNTTGSADGSFVAVVNGGVDAIVIQPSDGKVLIGGGFTSVNNATRNGIARLNSDGSLDATFDPGGGTCCVTSIVVEANGQIMIGGSFHAVNGIVRHHLARLNANGSLDPFVPGLAEAGGVSSFAFQPDGKILIAGSGPTVARLNTDGNFDPTFAMLNDSNVGVSSLVRQPDGRVLIAGSASQPGHTAHGMVRRLLSDGTPDMTFNTTFDTLENNLSYIESMLLQPDGKLIVAGQFTRVNGGPAWRVTRLHAFTPPCGTEPIVIGATPIRASHVTELRSCINTARSQHGLAPYAYTHATIVAGVTVVKAVDITEMRTAIGQVYAAAGLTPPAYTDPSLAPGMIIRAAHILELRSALSPFQ